LVLLDIYARSDITKLCKGNAYNRLQWEDVTVRGGWCIVVKQCKGVCVKTEGSLSRHRIDTGQ
jgi:hypothetical protein